ncbi:DNA mismatch repair protein Msh4 [Microthyrium microscopicum]|uniref:DNA mismatch repair protein Msh4 n=1 Tax=Microthyrium microscopicum TaxID=703497 RepID=A0A6A6U507_9PEZI|nr:DNA mismatch repair protein Msh4 [Microthyrium microscopicum]
MEMASMSRTSTSYASYASNSRSRSFPYNTTTTSRPRTGHSSGRPSTARPRTGVSTINNQQIICAITESRGVSPTVGIAMLNLHSGEAFLCQISDNQSYVRTIQKLSVYEPSEILVPQFAATYISKLNLCLEENLGDISTIRAVDRAFFAETAGLEYLNRLAFSEDVEALKVSIGGNYFAVCCFAAVIKHVDVKHHTKFPFHSLRVTYSSAEGSVVIDVSTINSLELIQNLENPKSKQCFFGLLNDTTTPMGARYLRTNILQPSTDVNKINSRLDAVGELSANQEMFMAVRQALKTFVDAEKVLTDIIIIPNNPSPWYREQAVNRLIMLKQFVLAVEPVFHALAGCQCELLCRIQSYCATSNIEPVIALINDTVNEDAMFAKAPLEIRNQRNYAIKSGSDGMLDIARQAFREAQDDAYEHIQAIQNETGLPVEIKFEVGRQFYIRFPKGDLTERFLPDVFINVVKRKDNLECQSLELLKLNQKIRDCELEIMQQCEKAVNELMDQIRQHMSSLYKCCESIALLDMLASFANATIANDYTRPDIAGTLAIRQGRHPIREKFQAQKYIPNDAYAARQSRFQIITGANMSGKSTYIRSIALINLMMQIGAFVPATHACLPIIHQLFARTSIDDSIEANASTFALEMREMAFILRNIDPHSLVIVDELGRGTSTRDGLAIAIAIAEALIESKAFVWFATHFKDLVKILAERPGVISLHMGVKIDDSMSEMTMLYQVAEGLVPNSHYGLALARVYPFPQDVIQYAEHVSDVLETQVRRSKNTSSAVVTSRKRKIMLHLKEQLEQARDGTLEGEPLRQWLIKLQQEFLLRMDAVIAEAKQAEVYSEDEADTQDSVMDVDN